MNVEIGTEAPIFLFWEYLCQIFGILSLLCTPCFLLPLTTSSSVCLTLLTSSSPVYLPPIYCLYPCFLLLFLLLPLRFCQTLLTSSPQFIIPFLLPLPLFPPSILTTSSSALSHRIYFRSSSPVSLPPTYCL